MLSFYYIKLLKSGKVQAVLVLLWISFICSQPAHAQQLDQIGKKGGIKVSGGVSLDQILYLTSGVRGRFNPYSYVLTGRLNISAYGWSVPLSFTYTNQELSYNAQPFNIVGLSPSYKNLTLHAGYRNLTFSPYTLAGHSFLGGGAEWEHQGFHVAAMYGRLLRATEYDSTENMLPVFDRFGGGIKVGYKKDGEELSLISFYAKDRQNSIAQPPEYLGVNPLENQVYSILLRKRLVDNLMFHFEGATSSLTKNTRGEVNNQFKTGLRNFFVMPVRANTVFYNAFNAGLTLALDKSTIGVAFERVDPEYRTLGAYYFNSDFQNITGNFSTRFLEDKLSVNLSAGIQRDDLDNQKLSRMKRFVGSAGFSMKFSEKVSSTLSYSNFNSFTNVKPLDRSFVENTPYDRLDTMNYQQVSQSVNAGLNLKPLENSRLVHNVNIGASYNDMHNERGESSTIVTMGSAFAGYNVSWKESGVTFGSNINGNINGYASGISSYLGIGVNTSMPFWEKKLRGTLSANFSSNYEEGDLTAYLFSVVNNYSLRLGEHHSLALNIRYTGRANLNESQFSTYNSSFHEFMGSLGYNFTF